MATDVRTEIEDRVAVLTLSNPSRRNAMDLELSEKLVAAVAAAVADDGVGAIVVTGEDPAFCAGGDLSELATADPATLRRVYSGFLAIADCPLPTIAAVNGAAVGAGLNLALAADLRLAGPRAKFDTRFLQLGLHPGGGYTWMINRVLGPQGAAAMSLFGEAVDAAEAERIGLVHRVADDVVAAALELAGRAAAANRELAVATKATLQLTAGMTSRAEAVTVEVRAQAESVRSDDFKQRLAALQQRISSSR
ncbi:MULTISPECIES: enoyl-CoA hydratase [unclassified Pseudonocardia]|jgi:enoyl-CoA hydratase|uniref:enoyl-CoA hydratase n=1 Tax=unclassified Pseudonocardia TaxID=2619320 RepID=UPI00095BDCD4|nr:MULTISPECIES: enoyl-CoA hydratase [unclassified Pseudonocardia]MBN9098243.1 enoyl-CoA hydratase [Pseudonocardia sp.]OJY52497.1 MAG: enoyl-CoA hydratase [Pseudonocardia sp. 73-21]